MRSSSGKRRTSRADARVEGMGRGAYGARMMSGQPAGTENIQRQLVSRKSLTLSSWTLRDGQQDWGAAHIANGIFLVNSVGTQRAPRVGRFVVDGGMQLHRTSQLNFINATRMIGWGCAALLTGVLVVS